MDDAARLAWARHGYEVGRIDTLRVAYIGAACAEVLADRNAHARIDIREIAMWFGIRATMRNVASATLDTLCALGDEAALALDALQPLP